MHILSSIYVGKFWNSIQISNNYEGTKIQTIAYKQNILPFLLW